MAPYPHLAFLRKHSSYNIYSQYPQVQPPRPDSRTSRPASRTRGTRSMETSRPSTALKADAPTPAPVKIQVESPGDAAGEPLVQDFQDRYLPKPQQSNTPAETPLASPYSAAATPQLATAHKLNQLSLSSADGDDESAPAPPDFTRRGIHIPTRTRQANAFPKQVRPPSPRGSS